jgi:hypothetical protein
MKRRDLLKRAAAAVGALGAGPVLLAAAPVAATGAAAVPMGVALTTGTTASSAFMVTGLETTFPFFWDPVVTQALAVPLLDELVMEDVFQWSKP